SATRFGGMENSSAIFYSEEAITTEALSEGTVSHEVAHQWFGDSATQSDWSHLWLSEGFATYFGNQFFEVADGEADFLRRMEEARQSYLASEVTNEPIVSRRPPSNLFQLLNANNYEKGGWVLHMLRGLLGDDTFFAGVKSYYGRYALSNADTDDFRHVLEETSGRPLQWFFDQWLLAPGYPVLDLEWQWDEAAASVRVDVRQIQRAGWPTFRIPTSIRIVTGDTATDTEVEITEREFSVRLPAPSRPDRVIVDPEGWILKGNASR
ncbi:MAG: M1 family aminopeptidase, partial [Gemmatimonadota bacterium]|nr:M1 family aminopeptidase [Gemmatimonadota bacterium]